MSTSTGVAPSRATTPADAKNEYGLVMTSSPGPMPSAMRATQQGVGTRRHANRVGDADRIGQLTLERVDLGSADESAAVENPGQRGHQRVTNRRVLCPNVKKRDCHKQRIISRFHVARFQGSRVPRFEGSNRQSEPEPWNVGTLELQEPLKPGSPDEPWNL